MDSKAVKLRAFAGSAGNFMQGIGGFVFGSENFTSNEDSNVAHYLGRISNGVSAEDKRAAMAQLQALVAESQSAQMAFGATGLPVLLKALKEEHDDVELIQSALETLVSALTPLESSRGSNSVVQPSSVNADLLSRELENISLILGLLSEEDFYVRYYTLQLLTALVTHSPKRLQEAILSIPRGVTCLMDMLMDREVIRNEALLLLCHLTREAEEIQKILAFEGAFDKIFSIINEEGGSDGGVVVLDSLELLNNLIRNNASNQILMKETIGFDPLVSMLKVRRGSLYNFTQQKTINLLKALETVELLLVGVSQSKLAKDSDRFSIQSAFALKKILDHLLMVGVESQWAPAAVRCMALRCIGHLIERNPQNIDALAYKQVGEEPRVEPALNAIFRIIQRTSILEEFVAGDFVFKCFCENNFDGQILLASTIPPDSSYTLDAAENMPFGSLLLYALASSEVNGDSETCCRAASILSYIIKDNAKSKQRVLQVDLEAKLPSVGRREPLLHRVLTYLSVATSMNNKDTDKANQSEMAYVQPLILRLLVIWLADCSRAVNCLLDNPANLKYMLELISDQHSSSFVCGLAALVLGECVLYNENQEPGRDQFAVVDAMSKKVGLTVYFQKLDEFHQACVLIHGRKMPTEESSSSEENQVTDSNAKHEDVFHPVLVEIFDVQFVNFLSKLEADIRESLANTFSRTKDKVSVLPFELEQKDGELDRDYTKRLRAFVEKQCNEMQDLLERNSMLAEELTKSGSSVSADPSQKISISRERVQADALRQDLVEASHRIESLKGEKSKLEEEANHYKNLATKLESDLKSLSDAYNSLEQNNVAMETEIRILRKGSSASSLLDVEAIQAEAREEAQKESEAELNDLLVCLGQERTRVEKLSARLAELGEDVESLLEGIGDESGIQDDDEEDDDEEDGK